MSMKISDIRLPVIWVYKVIELSKYPLLTRVKEPNLNKISPSISEKNKIPEIQSPMAFIK